MAQRRDLTSAEQMRNVLYELRMSQRGAARAIGINERTMRYYCAGDLTAPPVVWLALECLGLRTLDQSATGGERAGSPWRCPAAALPAALR